MRGLRVVRAGRQTVSADAVPKDSWTAKRRRWRKRLGAASRDWSEMLKEEDRVACIGAGVELRSRVRLEQSGPLTGQHYWVRLGCGGKEEGRRVKGAGRSQVPQRQRVMQGPGPEVM